MKWFRKKE